MQSTVSRYVVHAVHVRHFSGSVAKYARLTAKLWHEAMHLEGVLTKWQRIWLLACLVAKTPWWVLIKPMGLVFSTKSISDGHICVHECGRTYQCTHHVRECVQYHLLTVPIWQRTQLWDSNRVESWLMQH